MFCIHWGTYNNNKNNRVSRNLYANRSQPLYLGGWSRSFISSWLLSKSRGEGYLIGKKKKKKSACLWICAASRVRWKTHQSLLIESVELNMQTIHVTWFQRQSNIAVMAPPMASTSKRTPHFFQSNQFKVHIHVTPRAK